ncbi:MAG TPA: hypothetical protein VII76_16055 [Acidimicrobiales bacterium]
MDRTLQALLRSSHAQASYAEALGREGSRGHTSNTKRMSALRAEVETADAEVTLLRQKFLLRRGLSDLSASETRLVTTKS